MFFFEEDDDQQLRESHRVLAHIKRTLLLFPCMFTYLFFEKYNHQGFLLPSSPEVWAAATDDDLVGVQQRHQISLQKELVTNSQGDFYEMWRWMSHPFV